MKNFLYFQTAVAIEGTDSDEEAIMLPADSLIMIEPTNATAATLTFEGKGIGTHAASDSIDTIEVACAVTAGSVSGVHSSGTTCNSITVRATTA